MKLCQKCSKSLFWDPVCKNFRNLTDLVLVHDMTRRRTFNLLMCMVSKQAIFKMSVIHPKKNCRFEIDTTEHIIRKKRKKNWKSARRGRRFWIFCISMAMQHITVKIIFKKFVEYTNALRHWIKIEIKFIFFHGSKNKTQKVMQPL